MLLEDSAVFGRDEPRGASSHQSLPVHSQEARRSQICFLDYTVLVNGQVGDRGEIVKVSIFGSRGLQLGLGHAELFVLDLQLHLVHPELLKETGDILRRTRFDPTQLTGDAFFGLLAELIAAFRVSFGPWHDLSHKDFT